MIKMEKINELISSCLWTGYIKDITPVSMILIAKPEMGKTEVLKQYKFNKGCIYINDITAWGIVKKVFPRIVRGENVHHIIIPDFLNPLSKQKATSGAFIQFMSSLIEEGILDVKTYGIDATEILSALNKEIKCGLITAVTKEKFYQKRKLWKDIGFMSRLVPVTYNYSITTLIQILSSIYKEEYMIEKLLDLNFPDNKIDIKGNEEYNRKLNQIVIKIATKVGLEGLRLQKSYQGLMKGHALMNKRTEVNIYDYNFMEDI